MILLELDHIVVGAATLEEGAAHVEHALGVALSDGGKHTFMGTHNKLLRLGTDAYLEVIAIDPTTPAPPHPRWFNLGDPVFLASLKDKPRIIHWVVRTRNIGNATEGVPGANHPIVCASRGDLSWKITIPGDGTLPQDGAFPTFIEWPAGPHASERMERKHCNLIQLCINHPHAMTIAANLGSHLNDPRLNFLQADSAGFEALIQTSSGVRAIR